MATISEIQVVFREGKNPITYSSEQGVLGYGRDEYCHHVSIITPGLEGVNFIFDRDVVHHVELVEVGIEPPTA